MWLVSLLGLWAPTALKAQDNQNKLDPTQTPYHIVYNNQSNQQKTETFLNFLHHQIDLFIQNSKIHDAYLCRGVYESVFQQYQKSFPASPLPNVYHTQKNAIEHATDDLLRHTLENIMTSYGFQSYHFGHLTDSVYHIRMDTSKERLRNFGVNDIPIFVENAINLADPLEVLVGRPWSNIPSIYDAYQAGKHDPATQEKIFKGFIRYQHIQRIEIASQFTPIDTPSNRVDTAYILEPRSTVGGRQ